MQFGINWNDGYEVCVLMADERGCAGGSLFVTSDIVRAMQRLSSISIALILQTHNCVCLSNASTGA